MAGDKRRFQITHTGRFLERRRPGINYENTVFGLIKKNIDVLFPDLTNPSEFLSMPGRFDEPHVVAFDEDRKMPAVIVYRDEWDTKGLIRAQNYLKHIQHNKDEFKHHLRKKGYAGLQGLDWSDAYTIVVSLTAFTASEIDLPRDGGSLDLRRIFMHQDATLSLVPVPLSRVRPGPHLPNTVDSDMFVLMQMYDDIRKMIIKEFGGAAVTKNSKMRIEFRSPNRSGVYRVHMLEQAILFEHYDVFSRVVSNGEFEDVLPGLKEYLDPQKRDKIIHCL